MQKVRTSFVFRPGRRVLPVLRGRSALRVLPGLCALLASIGLASACSTIGLASASRAAGLLDDEPRLYTAGAGAGDADSSYENATASDWNVNEAHGPGDTLRFETDEATWVSVDVHPDGSKLVLDILGDLYTLPISGGVATRLTSGPAYDVQPRWSPDGRYVLFTSDRGGSDDIWMMTAEGRDLRPVTQDLGHEVNCPAWCPEGDYIVAKKRLTDFSSIGTTELWMYNIYGGDGIRLTKKDELPEINEPVCSPDGRFIYFSARESRYQYNRNVFQGIYQIQRYDRKTGERTTVTDGYGGSGRPALSHDGKKMAFVRRDRLDTVLYLFDLESRTERPIWNGLSGDMQENFANTGTYPGISFTPDGRAVVLWAEGKIWSVDLESGRPTEIPFRAEVEQTVAKALRFEREIAPDSVSIRMISWPTQSPDGKKLLFAAVGSLWEMPILTDASGKARGGKPRRLATEGARVYAPAYSPDGRWIAYVSWSDTEGGHVWRMPASGGRPTRLTQVASQYANPSFSGDGSKLVFIRGANAPLRGHNLSSEGSLDIIWMPSAGGEAQFVISIPSRGPASRMPRPRWNATGDRIYYTHDETTSIENEKVVLYSVRLDGSDRQAHLQLKWADDIIPSPDGKWAAYNELHNAYVTALPFAGRDPISVEGAQAPVPMRQFTKDGGEWLGWADGGRTVTWSSGPQFYRLPIDSLFAVWNRTQLEAGRKKTEPKEDDAEEKKDDDGDNGDGGDAKEKDTTDKKEEQKEEIHPDTLTVRLSLPRAKPSGVVAFTGGRIITMRGDEVIENGTIVIRDDRIEAVGEAGAIAIPDGAEVFDVGGATLLPGFVDVHAHFHYDSMDILPENQWESWCNLAYGVTTTHDPSASSYEVFTLSEMIETGVTKGPRTYSTGYILYGAGGAGRAVIEDLESARHHVRRLKRYGAFSVKSYMQPRRDQRQWIIQAAREESMLVVPEGGGQLETNLSMVLDGHTTIEHSLPVTPLSRDVVELFAQSGTAQTPTLLVAYGGIMGENWFYQHQEVWQNPKLLRFFPRPALDARAIRRAPMTIDGDWHHIEVSQQSKKILDAGGIITLGAHGQLQGMGAHWELWALAQGGMTSMEALRCATFNGAWALGLDHEIGSLEVGKLADLLVMERNPLDSIFNSDSIAYVVKNGEVFDGETMDQLWPVERPCPRFGFQVWGPPLPATREQ